MEHGPPETLREPPVELEVEHPAATFEVLLELARRLVQARRREEDARTDLVG
jgi:hypothetical protein